ncbi:MAG TPA: SH3 domain-containing protein [Pyrinomonadaceae bacterium]|nr:SH3 domain-containing protein [Pyrinomonadaceae bacterium]
MRRLLIPLLCPCLVAALATGWTGGTQTQTNADLIEAAQMKCDVAAYVVDPDPNGLNVRSGPGKAFTVVGTIPRRESAVEVRVTGATGQWLRIRDAVTQEEDETVFKGEGWVFGPMLVTQTKNYASLDPNALNVKVFKEPTKRSAVVTRLPNETEVKLVGCKGNWAQIQHKKLTGWLDPDSQCASTLTNCS